MTNLFVDAHCCVFLSSSVFNKSEYEVKFILLMPIMVSLKDKNKESVNLHPENQTVSH